jgi:hypothetical protein
LVRFDFTVKNLAAGAAAWMPLFPEFAAGGPAGMPAVAIYEFLPRKNS